MISFLLISELGIIQSIELPVFDLSNFSAYGWWGYGATVRNGKRASLCTRRHKPRPETRPRRPLPRLLKIWPRCQCVSRLRPLSCFRIWIFWKQTQQTVFKHFRDDWIISYVSVILQSYILRCTVLSSLGIGIDKLGMPGLFRKALFRR
jgi:hypothetical protein